MGYRSLRPTAAVGSAQGGGSYLDYADTADILQNPEFLEDLREELRLGIGGEDVDNWTDEELVDRFYQNMTWANNNSVAALIEYGQTATASDTRRARMARLQRAYEIAPTRDISDPDAWLDWAPALLIDPLNAFAIGKAGAGAWQAARAGRNVISGGLRAGATAGAVEGAVSEAAIDTINQNRFIEAGLQDEFSFGRLGLATGAGALGGSAIGGTLGAAAAVPGARTMRRTAEELLSSGVTREELMGSNFSDYGRVREIMPEVRQQARLDATARDYRTGLDQDTRTFQPSQRAAEEAATEQPRFDSAVLQSELDRARNVLAQLHADGGATRSDIQAAEAEVVRAEALQHINAVIQNFENNTARLLESDDAGVRATAERNAAQVVRLRGLAEGLQRREANAVAARAEADRIAAQASPAPAQAAPEPTPEGAAPPAEAAPASPEGAAPTQEAPPSTAEAAAQPEAPIAPAEAQPATPPREIGAQDAARGWDGGPPDVYDEAQRAEWQAGFDEALPPSPEAAAEFAAIMDGLSELRGIPEFTNGATFRDLVARVAGDTTDENGVSGDEIMRLFDREFDASGAPRQDSAATRRQRQVATKVGTPAEPEVERFNLDEATDEMGESLRAQLQQSGVLGRLVAREARARGTAGTEAEAKGAAAEAAIREQDELAAKNAKITPEGRVRSPQRSASGRAGDTLAEGPVTAGRGENGRMQAILRPGQATERDPVTGEATRTITEGEAPRRSQFSREEFELASQADPETPVARWVTTEPMTDVIGGTSRTYRTKRGREKTQRGYVPKGTTVFYVSATDSPNVGKYYIDPNVAMAAAGRAKSPTIPRSVADERGLTYEGGGRAADEPVAAGAEARPAEAAAAEAAPTRDSVDVEDMQEAVRAYMAGEMSSDEFFAYSKALRERALRDSEVPAEREVGRAAEAAPATGDAVLAIRSRADPNVVRVLSDRQIEMGGDLTTLLGKSDISKWEVGYVRNGTRTLSPQAADEFTPATAVQERAALDGSISPDDVDYTTGNNIPPLTTEEAASTMIDLTALSGDEFSSLRAMLQQVTGQNIARDTKLSLQNLAVGISKTESLPWPTTRSGVERRASQLRDVYALQARLNPEGIRRNVQSKTAAKDSLDTVLAGADPRDIAEAKGILDALSETDGRRAPVFRNGKVAAYSTGTNPDIDNTIAIRSGAPQGGELPRAVTVAHEVAHWGYNNILTPQDRLEFWDIISRNYYDENGNLNRELARSRAAPNDVVLNAEESPQEFFANQFSAWVMQRGRGGNTLASDDGFWTRISRTFKQLMDKVLGRNFLDPDFEPLFQKIMPDEAGPEVSFAPLRMPENLKVNQSRYIISHINQTAMLHDELLNHVQLGQIDSALATARDLAGFLFKLTAINNTFRPLTGNAAKKAGKGNIAKMVRDAAYKISEAIEAKVDEDALNRAVPIDMDEAADDAFDFDAGIDAADIWLARNDASDTMSPEASFEALQAIMDNGTPTSVQGVVEQVLMRLNMTLRRNEGWAYPETVLPNAYAIARRKRALNGEPSGKRLRRERAKKTTETTKAIEEAVKTARTPPSKRPAAAAPDSDPSVLRRGSARSMPMEELIEGYRSANAADRDTIAYEVLRRVKSEPDSDWGKSGIRVTNDIKNMRSDEMNAALQRAFDEGDGPQAEQILQEAWRRGENKRRKKAGKKPIAARLTSTTNKLVETENTQSFGVVNDGITPGAPAVIREVQSFMSHRDPEVQNTMRTLVYRALNMRGKAMRNALGETNIMTVADVARLANREPSAAAGGVFADFRSAEFNSLRKDMRRMAIGLTRDVSNPFDVMHEIHHLALRTDIFNPDEFAVIRDSFMEAARANDAVAERIMQKYGNGQTLDRMNPRQIDRVAEEWFAEHGALYAMGKVAKGDLWAIRKSGDMTALKAKPALITMANRLIEAVAYLVNGLLGRKTMKQMFRRIDSYGDMFTRPRANVRANKNGDVAPEYASAYYGEMMASMPEARLDNVRNFVAKGAGAEANGDPIIFYHGTPSGDVMSARDVVMYPGRGDFGRGVYLTRDQQVANDVYANNSTYDAMMTRARTLRDEGTLSAEDYQEVADTIISISDLRRETGALLRHRAVLAEESPNSPAMERITERVLASQEVEEILLDELAARGFSEAPSVLGVVVRAENTADFTPQRIHHATDSFTTRLIAKLEEEGAIEFRRITSWYRNYPEEGYRGTELHGHLTRMVMASNDTLDHKQATEIISDAVGSLGYDSIRARFPNTMPDGTVTHHDGLVIIDHIDRTTNSRVSASSRVKSVEAREFDATDDRLYYSLVSDTPNPNSAVIRTALENRDTRPALAVEILGRLEADGAPKDFTQLASSMIRNRRVNFDKATDTLGKAVRATMSSVPLQLEKAGLRMPSEFHASHYTAHNAAMGERVFGLKDLLAKLPDSQSGFQRWLRNSYLPGKEPESHTRILKALRMGADSPQFKRLSDVEKEVAQGIRTLLDREFDELRRAGVIVGKVENYFPQIWDVEGIKRDQADFVEKLANYFQAEASKDGRRMDRAEAVETAEGVWGRLVDDENHYLPPPVGSSRTADSDHIRYQRLIRLEDPSFNLNAEELTPYLMNDLEGSLIKYFDGSARSILQGRRFGTMNHGYWDYLHVMQEGVNGVADLLSTNRVARRETKTLDASGNPTMLEFRDETVMPFADNPTAAVPAAREVLRIYQTDGAAAAKDYLMRLDVSRTRPEMIEGSTYLRPDKSTYEHRVDAIIDALRDGNGQRRAVTPEDHRLAEQAMMLAMKKPVGSHSEMLRTTSRGLRTFNAVSLLTFTALTSLTDVILPTLRSGKASAQIKAIMNYRSDPDYARAIRNTGVAIESIVHQRMAGLFAADVSGKMGQFNNRFFNATLLTPWTDMMRKVAGATGYEAFKTDVSRAIKMRVGDGSDLNAQPPEYRRIVRRLNHYGLGEYLERGTELSTADMEDLPMKKAIIQFANESIFAPDPSDMPMWTNTPWGSVIWQLKSYPIMFGRMAKDILWDGAAGDLSRAVKNRDWSEIDPNNLRRLAYFLSLGPMFGAVALGAKDVVQMRGGEDGRSADLRVRNAANFFGYDEDIHGGNESDFLGWYLEGMMAIGSLGFLADMMHTIAEQTDNGAYGKNRVASFVGGPSVGTAFAAQDILAGITDTNDRSNAKERTAWREALRRVPLIGGNTGLREGAVDALAGEADN